MLLLVLNITRVLVVSIQCPRASTRRPKYSGSSFGNPQRKRGSEHSSRQSHYSHEDKRLRLCQQSAACK
ncbi:hypothetical protein PVAP13_3KG025727 [Panicum virgatum]|uniref:Secreted protein n=1 Tax=Panicum virgatum TaxID=38727 RepID=A0A8T0UQ96_PANVG|nr:hypothetical protein PVAP13_3KG025727 [Panicum virgatum]